LNGVAVVTTDSSEPLLVATDGRRLSRIPLGAESVAENPKANYPRVAIVPAKAVSLLIGTLPKDVTINAIQTPRGMAFVAANTVQKYELYTKLVDGNFPNFKQVIPKDADAGIEFTVKGDEFMAALERVEVLTTEKSSSVKLTFSDQKLRFDTASPDAGTGTEPISATSKTASELLEVAFNPVYLLEIIGSWKPDTFTVSVKDSVSPILLRSEGRLAVVMPVRLS
jgi:DNA polymerase-3 subunit beta